MRTDRRLGDFHTQSWGLKSKIKALAGLASSEAPMLGV